MIKWSTFKNSHKEYIAFDESKGFLYYMYTSTESYLVAVKNSRVTIITD